MTKLLFLFLLLMAMFIIPSCATTEQAMKFEKTYPFGQMSRTKHIKTKKAKRKKHFRFFYSKQQCNY